MCWGEPELETEKHHATSPDLDLADRRRLPRFKVEVKIGVHSRTCGLLKGHTVDISESGISAILKMEVPVGELVELEFVLPFGPVTAYAMVRQKNAFRYGFHFVEFNSAKEKEFVQATCRQLSVEQSLLAPP